ncbi:hypothetical protein ACKKBF_B36920 [Auxenochlorella protothecoides x Auxenochlorella symbiontica]
MRYETAAVTGSAPPSTSTALIQKAAPSAGRPSRGLLPAAYLASGSAELPAEFLNGVDAQAFEGFNLLLVDLVRRSCAYLSNGRGERVCAGVDPGLHGLANGLLDAPDFAKVQHGKRQLVALQRSGAFDGDDLPWEEVWPESRGRRVLDLGGHSFEGVHCCVPCASFTARYWLCRPSGPRLQHSPPPSPGQLFGIMSQPEVLASEAGPLPATGYDAAFESLVSGVFIPPTHLPALGDDSWYGTRSQTLLAIGRDGRAQCRERYLDWRGPQEAEWREVDLDLRVAVQ